MKRLTVALLFIPMISLAYGQFPEFRYIPIGNTTDRTSQTSLVDVDKDGDLDWVVGSADTVWWFETQPGDHWVKHVLGVAPITESAGMMIDVNGDGLPDQVSGSTWFRNEGPGKPFTRLLNGAKTASDMAVADINSDGKPDVVYMNDKDGIIWYDFSKNSAKKWKGTKIGPGVRSGIGPMGLADLDGDGDIDVVRSNCWFENVDNGEKWIEHPSLKLANPGEKFPNCSMVWVVDLNKDGKPEIIQAESYYPNCKLVWLQKQDTRGLTWFLNKIDLDTKQEIHSLIVADFDNDGDLDVFVGGSGSPADYHVRSFIYENVDGNGLQWKKHEILTDKECYGAQVGDIDGDGDLDICAKPWNGTENYLLKNMLMESKKGGK